MDLFSVRFINKTIQILLGLLFIINVGASLYMPIFSVFVTEHIVEASLSVAGLSVALYAIVKSIIQVPLARSLDLHIGEEDDFWLLIAGVSIGIIYTFSFVMISEVWQLFAVQIISGMGDACLMAAYYAIFSHHIDKHSEGFEWSLLSVGGLTVSVAIGGAIGGFIAEIYGFDVIFIIAGCLNIVGLFLLLILKPYIKKFRSVHHYKTITHINN